MPNILNIQIHLWLNSMKFHCHGFDVLDFGLPNFKTFSNFLIVAISPTQLLCSKSVTKDFIGQYFQGNYQTNQHPQIQMITLVFHYRPYCALANQHLCLFQSIHNNQMTYNPLNDVSHVFNFLINKILTRKKTKFLKF